MPMILKVTRISKLVLLPLYMASKDKRTALIIMSEYLLSGVEFPTSITIEYNFYFLRIEYPPNSCPFELFKFIFIKRFKIFIKIR